MPFLLDDVNLRIGDNYTAVIYVQIGAPLTPNNALYKLVKTITKSQFVDRVSTTIIYHYIYINIYINLYKIQLKVINIEEKKTKWN